MSKVISKRHFRRKTALSVKKTYHEMSLTLYENLNNSTNSLYENQIFNIDKKVNCTNDNLYVSSPKNFQFSENAEEKSSKNLSLNAYYATILPYESPFSQINNGSFSHTVDFTSEENEFKQKLKL